MVFNIFYGGKFCKFVFKNVYFEWVVIVDIYINTYVKFVVVDEVRTIQIFLYNDWSFSGDLCLFVDDFDFNFFGRSRLKLIEKFFYFIDLMEIYEYIL